MARPEKPVYLDWLAERLEPAAELDRDATRLVRFQRVRVSRGNAGTLKARTLLFTAC